MTLLIQGRVRFDSPLKYHSLPSDERRHKVNPVHQLTPDHPYIRVVREGFERADGDYHGTSAGLF